MVTRNSKKMFVFGAWLCLAIAPPLVAQSVEFQVGVRAGVPLTRFFLSDLPAFNVRETAERVWFTAGPTFGAVLHNRFLIELDAMYKPFRALQQPVRSPGGSTFELKAASFEFPLVVDYFFSRGERRSFAGFGVVAGYVGTGTIESHLMVPPGSVETPFEGQLLLRNQLPAYVANAGMEWNKPGLVIRPEVRYTNWRRSHGFQIDPHQVEVSIGFWLRPRR